MGKNLSVLAVDLGVDQDVGAGLVVVPIVVRRVLMPPGDLAAARVEGDGARGVEIVARPERGIVGRYRIAGAPIGQVVGRIVSPGAVERAAAGQVGVDLVLPGLAAGL